MCVGCSNGEVRLVNGHARYEGRVEICLNSTWGVICQGRWTNTDSRVVCRQLGFTATGECITSSSHYIMSQWWWYNTGSIAATSFGQGSRRIVLNDVQCDGSETRLIDCHTGPSSCSNTNQAGVKCQVQGGKTLLLDGFQGITVSASRLHWWRNQVGACQ